MPKEPLIARLGPLVVLVLLALTVLAPSCATVPYTGREQFVIVSEEQSRELGAQAAQETLRQERLSQDPRLVAQVQAVGRRIAAAADRPDYQWRFNVIDNPKTANAFALPGGQVFVYSGLMSYVKNDAQLAAVMGHEVAHVLARHGAERMSVTAAAQTGGALLGAALGTSSQAFQEAYGIAANYGVILPYSRAHETEADRIGLILMAKAGYDPGQAVDFWTSMAQSAKGSQPPPFLSTHPAHAQRIRDIRAFLPEARRYYRG